MSAFACAISRSECPTFGPPPSSLNVEHSASWLSEILRRSKSESLSLSCHEPDEDFDDQDDACDVLSQPCHLSRIKRLTITDLHGWRPFALTLLTEPAPRLESLSLGPRMSKWLHTSSSSKPKVTVLPSTLFQTGSESAIVPPLRSLSLVYRDVFVPKVGARGDIVLEVQSELVDWLWKVCREAREKAREHHATTSQTCAQRSCDCPVGKITFTELWCVEQIQNERAGLQT